MINDARIWVRMVQLGIILLELTNYNCRRKNIGDFFVSMQNITSISPDIKECGPSL